MKLSELADGVIPALAHGHSGADVEITGLTSDSRAVAPGFVFAALPGTRADGAAFIPAALAAGAACVLMADDAEWAGEPAHVPVLRVREPRRALALMAARFHPEQPGVIAAITGTNGKTSVASFLRQIWLADGRHAASIGTLGVATPAGTKPLRHTTPEPVELHSILAELARAGITHMALEASSHGLAQHRLDGVRLSAGAFTNITRDHLDYHPDFESYLAAKLRLFNDLLGKGAPAVIDADRPEAEGLAETFRAQGLAVWRVGRAGDVVRLEGLEAEAHTQRLTIRYDGELHRVRLPLAGTFQVSNALVASGLALATGTPPEIVFAALERLQGACGRLEFMGGPRTGGGVFIDYAHTPDALASALGALRPFARGRLNVVFGCGGDRDRGKRPQMGAVAQQLADRIYVTDDNPRSEDPSVIRQEIMASATRACEIACRQTAIHQAVSELRDGDVLLVAGKGHETGQIIGAQTLPFSDHDAVRSALAMADRGSAAIR